MSWALLPVTLQRNPPPLEPDPAGSIAGKSSSAHPASGPGLARDAPGGQVKIHSLLSVPLQGRAPCWAAVPVPCHGLAGTACPLPQGCSCTGGRAGARHCPGPASAHPPAPQQGLAMGMALVDGCSLSRGLRQGCQAECEGAEMPLMPSPALVALVPQFPWQTVRLCPSSG